jgi:hypothetical protein
VINTTQSSFLLFILLNTQTSFGDFSNTPNYSGSGCPSGTAAVSLRQESPDGSSGSFDISFSAYQTLAGKSFGKNISRKSCTLTIPVQIPKGFKIAITRSEYRGYSSLPMGAISTINLAYSFGNSLLEPIRERTPSIRKLLYGEQNQYFYDLLRTPKDQMKWSPCGGPVNLNIISSIISETNVYGQPATLSLNQASNNPSLLLHFESISCSTETGH